MKMFSNKDHKRKFARYGFVNLLVCLFAYLVVGPFLEGTHYARHIMSVLLTVVLLAAVGTMNQRTLLNRFSFGFLIVAVVMIWIQSLGLYHSRFDISASATVLFLAPLVYMLGKYILQTREVTGNLICCALCLYLLIGMLWGGVFAVLESVQPGSFAGQLLAEGAPLQERRHHLEYFSYVTLSTLGYGDITPQTRGAEALCQVEAIIGQFFAMVIVARLVGLQVAQQAKAGSQTERSD